MRSFRRPIFAGLLIASIGSVPGAMAATTGSTAASPEDHQAAGHHMPSAVDHGHEPFQPGYLGGHTVVYQPGPPVAEAAVVPLYQVRYPDGWTKLTARPLCNYCDHAQNGEDAADYHDHVLAPPDRRANAAGRVTWHVYDVVPAYTGDPDHDAAVSAAIAGRLPVQSVGQVSRLALRRMPDGSSIVRVVDTGVEFGGPITSRY
jgi:hypothetical protein